MYVNISLNARKVHSNLQFVNALGNHSQMHACMHLVTNCVTIIAHVPAMAFVGKPCLRQGTNGNPCPLSSAALRQLSVRRGSARPRTGATSTDCDGNSDGHGDGHDDSGHPQSESPDDGPIEGMVERCTRCRTAALTVAAPDLVRRLLDRGGACGDVCMYHASMA